MKPRKQTNKITTCLGELLKRYNVLGHVRSGYFGDVYAVSKGKHIGTRDITTLGRHSSNSFDYIMKVTSNNKVAMHEVKLLYDINKIKSIHLPKLISHHKCDNMKFRGWKKQGIALSHKDWTFVKEGKGLILFMENSGMGMDIYLKKNTNVMNEVVMIFQLLYTIFLLENAGITHNDIYTPNIVTKKVSENTMVYKIGETLMKVPILDGRVPVLIDFGQSQHTNTKSNVDKEMLLSTWYHYTQNPEIKQFVRMLRESDLSNTREFLIQYYNKYIRLE